MSEISVPMTVSTLSRNTKLPARYMSCDFSACSNNGPFVGRFRTTETIVTPEIKPGSAHPIVETNGMRATRTGYLRMTFHSGRPFAGRCN